MDSEQLLVVPSVVPLALVTVCPRGDGFFRCPKGPREDPSIRGFAVAFGGQRGVPFDGLMALSTEVFDGKQSVSGWVAGEGRSSRALGSLLRVPDTS